MKTQAPQHIELSQRVPGTYGRAFDVASWYEARKKQADAAADLRPTHMKVEAADEFQACIPWGQLGSAAFLYEQDGAPLKKGFPIRLYVPDGSSECLNVKSVVHVWFLYDESLGEEATYGFKNTFSPEQLRKK
nr:hypothetical protein [Paenibacillus hamazuiensis]